jgi:hypothetical protein
LKSDRISLKSEVVKQRNQVVIVNGEVQIIAPTFGIKNKDPLLNGEVKVVERDHSDGPRIC